MPRCVTVLMVAGLVLLSVAGLWGEESGEGGVHIESECPSKEARADSLTQAARVLLREKRGGEALACLRKAVAATPTYVAALKELGTLLSTRKEYHAAEQYLSAAIAHEGPTASALNNLAIAYQELGNHADAVRMYKRVLKLDEDDAAAHYNLGTALEKAGEYKDAVKWYKMAIDLEPEEAKYYNNMGGSLAAYNKTETAERSYKWAIKLSPKWADAYFNLGNMLLGTNQVEKAIERLEVAVKIQPSHAKARAKLADAHTELENKVKAFKTEVDAAIDKAQKMMDRGELR